MFVGWVDLRKGGEAPGRLVVGDPVGEGRGWEELFRIGGTEALIGETPVGDWSGECECVPGFGLLVPLGFDVAEKPNECVCNSKRIKEEGSSLGSGS